MLIQFNLIRKIKKQSIKRNKNYFIKEKWKFPRNFEDFNTFFLKINFKQKA